MPQEKLLLLTAALLFAVSWFFFIKGALQESPYRYLYLILAWATPVLFLQWQVGYSTLLSFRKELGLAIAALTSYFWVADSFAIWQGIWAFPENSISGFKLFGILPIEEALFFFVTNCMVVQGFILFTRMDLQAFKLRLSRS